MKKLFLIILALSIHVNSYSQLNEASIKLYQTTRDFIKESAWDVDAVALITNESDYHLQIEKIVDSSTRKNIKRGHSVWAIEYKGDKYFNLGYSGDLNRWGLYIKFDIIGRYSVIIIDDNIPFNTKTDTRNFGGGLEGILIKEASTWGKNWEDESESKKKILFIDTHDLDRNAHFSHNAQCATANYLTKSKLKEIMGERFPDIDLKEVTFEQAIEIIGKLNELLKF